jgi:hypothetical protein
MPSPLIATAPSRPGSPGRASESTARPGRVVRFRTCVDRDLRIPDFGVVAAKRNDQGNTGRRRAAGQRRANVIAAKRNDQGNTGRRRAARQRRANVIAAKRNDEGNTGRRRAARQRSANVIAAKRNETRFVAFERNDGQNRRG